MRIILKYIISFLLLFVLFATNSCGDKMDEKLIFVNNSDNTIALFDAKNFPDTLQLVHDLTFFDELIAPRSSRKLSIKGDWEAFINGLPNQTIMFYAVNKDSLDRYTDVYYIIQNNKIEKRYDLTVGDLKATNWTITYP